VAPLTWLRKVTTSALETADPSGQKGANVVIADDTTLHDLNHRFRGLDQVTDVLSFGDISAEAVAADGSGGTDEPAPEFPKPPAKEAIWGEVIISCPRRSVRPGSTDGTWNMNLRFWWCTGSCTWLDTTTQSLKTRP